MVPGPRRLLTGRLPGEVVTEIKLLANQPGKGKTRWEVSMHEPRALIMPNYGVFEA